MSLCLVLRFIYCFSECHYAVCRYAKCRCAEYRGASLKTLLYEANNLAYAISPSMTNERQFYIIDSSGQYNKTFFFVIDVPKKLSSPSQCLQTRSGVNVIKHFCP